jgi:uncharacterized protein
LLGNLASTRKLPPLALALAVAVVVGGSAGSYFGSRRFPHTVIRRLLAVVLLVVEEKLIFTR